MELVRELIGVNDMYDIVVEYTNRIFLVESPNLHTDVELIIYLDGINSSSIIYKKLNEFTGIMTYHTMEADPLISNNYKPAYHSFDNGVTMTKSKTNWYNIKKDCIIYLDIATSMNPVQKDDPFEINPDVLKYIDLYKPDGYVIKIIPNTKKILFKNDKYSKLCREPLVITDYGNNTELVKRVYSY